MVFMYSSNTVFILNVKLSNALHKFKDLVVNKLTNDLMQILGLT